jgi:small-conductance mechanosensitive channel
VRGTFGSLVLASLASFLDPPSDAAAGMTALWEHIAQRWAFVALGGGIVGVAWLVNRFAPSKRRRIRRTLIPFLIYLVLWAISATFAAGHAQDWADRVHVGAELFEIYTVINLTGLAVFDLALPALKVDTATIVADLIIGGGYILGTIGVLRSNGMEPSSVVATSAVVSGILALSLQATLGNILGGVALQLDHSLHAGDWIQLPDGTQGKVRAVRWRHTVVETRNWDTLLVPNSSLLAQNIVILGKREGCPVQHRMWVYFNVDFRYSPSHVIAVVQEALRGAPMERVAMDPPPNVICYDFAKDGRDSFGYYAVRYWLTDLAIDDPTSSAIREHVYAALRRANIPLARPTQTVLFAPDDSHDLEGRAARHRVARAKILTQVELFNPLTDAERTHLADHLVYAPFAKGETITHQGAVAHWLYILVGGRAEIRSKTDDDAKSRLVATLQAPAVFGEMGLFTGAPRTADVVAATDVECYRLDKPGFEQIIHDRPEIAAELAKTMGKRRIELGAAMDGVPVESRRGEELGESERILGRIRDFFGLARGDG